MSIVVMSPNGPETDSPGNRKRTHDDFSEACAKTELQQDTRMDLSDIGTAIPQHIAMSCAQTPPAQSSPAALTDAGCSTPANGPASPDTPTRQPLKPVHSAQNIPAATHSVTMPPPNTVLPTGQGPPKKKKKLTPAERAVKDAEDAARKAAREAEEANRKAARQAEEATRRAAREQKAAEAEAKKKVKEEKAAEAEAKKKAKEEKDREKREEADRKREEADRKARAQTKIASFFVKKDPTTPKPNPIVDAVVKARSPSPVPVQSEYAKLALPFFVHSSVSMAKHPFDVDGETREVKTNILSEYMAGTRPPVALQPFDPVSRLQLASAPPPRGRSFPAVRDLMADHEGGASNPIDLIAESLSLPKKKTLKEIPMKQFLFHEDVRPGYYGTVTSVQSVQALKKMARHPMAKDLPLNYDYDSEAEWVEGEEEEDDAADDMTDDEEGDGEAESLDGFLDDDDDDAARPAGRLPMGNMEPESSGICFEDHYRVNANPQMYKFRMEFLIPDLRHRHSIDPFSTEYWPLSTKSPTSAEKAPKALKVIKPKVGSKVAGAIMPPPPTPAKTAMTSSAKAPTSPVSLVPAEDMDNFKACVMEFKYLAKGALVPTLKKRFDRCTSSQLKATLEHVAEKHGRKDWELKTIL